MSEDTLEQAFKIKNFIKEFPTYGTLYNHNTMIELEERYKYG
ncbi:13095_t:CDS:2 [Rhizophagus irregularis]|nr:13095_t:CDS:2 [Rhizophagus irregularis]